VFNTGELVMCVWSVM